MRLHRLNGDSSWHITLDDVRLLIDPWLVGSQIEGARWFSEQWHVQPCVPPEAVPEFDAIVIAYPFTDHCHRQTLEALPKRPILCSPRLHRRLAGLGPLRTLDDPGLPLRLRRLPAPSFADPLHSALLIEGDEGALFYAPHGHDVTDTLQARADCLLAPLLHYRLPWLLGGTILQGAANTAALRDRLGARLVLDTHSEPKRATGLVARLRHMTPGTLPGAQTLPPNTTLQFGVSPPPP